MSNNICFLCGLIMSEDDSTSASIVGTAKSLCPLCTKVVFEVDNGKSARE